MNILEDNIYQLDTRPQGAKTIEKMANTVKSLTTEPRSVSNVVTQTIKPKIADKQTHLYYDTINTRYYNLEYWKNSYNVFTLDSTGFYYPPAGGTDPFISDYFLQNPKLLRINNINEIALSTEITERFFPTFGPIPVATSNYSFDYFITLGIQNTNIDINWSSTYEVYKELTFFKWTYTYTLSTNSWSVTTRNITKRFNANTLNDKTINSTFWGIPRQNFNTYPDKISTENWNKLINQNNFLSIVNGFSASTNSLTGVNLRTWLATPSNSNLAHFQHYFGGFYDLTLNNATFLPPSYVITATLNFNYFGLLTPYQPNS